jgi:hypothetical protein
MATRGDSCVKRDVCTFYGCGSTSDLCADCGHYLAEAVKTPTNTGSHAISQLAQAYVIDIGMGAENREQVLHFARWVEKQQASA